MRIIATLAAVGSVLLVGFAALSRQSGVAATHAGNNSSLPAVDAVLQTGSRTLGVTIPPVLAAAFAMGGLAVLAAAYAAGGR